MTDKQLFFDHRTATTFEVDRKDLLDHWDWTAVHPDMDPHYSVEGDWTADRVLELLPQVTADLGELGGDVVPADLRPGKSDQHVRLVLPGDDLDVLALTAAGSLNGDRPLRVPGPGTPRRQAAR
jgi:hypothetical protein